MGLIGLIPVLGELIEKVIPDPNKRMELNLQLAKLADAESARENELLKAQTVTNTAEAGHRSLFVAGWRPAVGWICAGSLAYNVILAPAFSLGIADLSFLQTILMGMLGLSISRSYEKVKGVANDVLPVFNNKEEKKKSRILPFDIPGIKGI